jgi:hypothetical protein
MMFDGSTRLYPLRSNFVNDIFLLYFLIKLLYNQLIISLINDFSFFNIISLDNDHCI